MKFFTVMIITYMTSQGPVESRILFPSADECGDAIGVMSQVMAPYEDVAVSCHRSELLSWTVRPRGRDD